MMAEAKQTPAGQTASSLCYNHESEENDDTNLHDDLANGCSISGDIEENTGSHLELIEEISEDSEIDEYLEDGRQIAE